MENYQITINFKASDRETAEKAFELMRNTLDSLLSVAYEDWSTLQVETANGQRLEPVRMCT